MKRPPDDLPVIDLHCDLLSYLATIPGAHPGKTQDIGCAIPHLKEGNVKLQVLAVYTGRERGSARSAQEQGELFRRILQEHGETFTSVATAGELEIALRSRKIGIVLAIENASGLCEEDEPIDRAFGRLDSLIEKAGRVLYISLTHHGENRFGGGNTSRAGLKDDGRALLDYLDGRGIAIDLSHTSDDLAFGILEHSASHGLDLPIIASHSNYRAVCDKRRNLPDEIAREIIRREGLIGVNLLREYVDPERPEMLAEHIRYAMELGARNALCFGADYFYMKAHPDRTRVPFFHPGHEHSGRYQEILRSLDSLLDEEAQRSLAHGNARRFMAGLWGVAIRPSASADAQADTLRTKVIDILNEHKIAYRVLPHDEPVFTVDAAASQRGVVKEEMVKSILLADKGGQYVMACVTGDSRLDPKAVRAHLGEGWSRLRFASAGEIEAVTGCVQGAVSPVGLPGNVPVVFDEGIARCERVNMSSGDPNAGLELDSGDLIRVTGAQLASITATA
jgi:microsomal dipeptidase-like Zn-dependent dipeptidase/prolyl-tRNA editing enzyme YbaK/EbsC (Cys-tRNA(Pro) deacylase)